MYNNNPYMSYMPYNMNVNPNNPYGMEEYPQENMQMNYMVPGYMPMDYMKPEYMPMSYAKPMMMPKEKDIKCVKVPEVIGRNYTQILLEQEIPFAPGYPALEIKDITKEVKELVLSVCKDKVLINGKLHKNINYKTFTCSGKAKCCCEDLELTYGDLRHVHVAIPFAGYIEVPGARPGDSVEVEYAGVDDCCELDILMDPVYVKGCTHPVYKKVKEKVIVKIDVKVLRPVQITVDPEFPNICP